MNNENGFMQLLDHPDCNAELGALVGHLVGDAMGVLWEFQQPESLPKRSQIEMHMPKGFHRSHSGVPVGTYSDDGAQMLCLLACLIEQQEFSLIDFSGKLLRWLDIGFMAVDNEVFDVGNQTAAALGKLRNGVSPEESGGKSEMDCGNGSLMRVLPLALWHSGTDEELVRDAHLSSLPTHAHPRAMVACAFYCLVARGYLNRLSDPWQWADQRLEELYKNWSGRRQGRVLLAELDVLHSFTKTDQPRGTGYVIDTVWSARRALEEDSFDDVVRTAILFGNDTDTTAAVAGGLAGIRFGIAGIPKRWLQQLRGFELVEPMLPGFLLAMKSKKLSSN